MKALALRNSMIWSYEAQGLAEKAILDACRPFHRPTIITDLTERIVAVNRDWVTMCKFSATEALGNSPKMLHGALTNREGASHFSATLRSGKYAPCAVVLNYKKDGSLFRNGIFGWQLGDLLIAETYAEEEVHCGASQGGESAAACLALFSD